MTSNDNELFHTNPDTSEIYLFTPLETAITDRVWKLGIYEHCLTTQNNPLARHRKRRDTRIAIFDRGHNPLHDSNISQLCNEMLLQHRKGTGLGFQTSSIRTSYHLKSLDPPSQDFQTFNKQLHLVAEFPCDLSNCTNATMLVNASNTHKRQLTK